jgi:hypothetical protein
VSGPLGYTSGLIKNDRLLRVDCLFQQHFLCNAIASKLKVALIDGNIFDFIRIGHIEERLLGLVIVQTFSNMAVDSELAT